MKCAAQLMRCSRTEKAETKKSSEFTGKKRAAPYAVSRRLGLGRAATSSKGTTKDTSVQAFPPLQHMYLLSLRSPPQPKPRPPRLANFPSPQIIIPSSFGFPVAHRPSPARFGPCQTADLHHYQPSSCLCAVTERDDSLAFWDASVFLPILVVVINLGAQLRALYPIRKSALSWSQRRNVSGQPA
ncbi:hypothetical protein CFIO01_08023 [Colletotrichum fioriniae PJ7]|uniref:Uncharacterized protein n=1 Tax=Colletotrichum fioriniae PJ7 TaxID=1445577 RepID=A0A010QNK4_9PEZI|nr:hypothetical protein CFIO01_08023 [Colletotrichum fioriniae PJ7]